MVGKVAVINTPLMTVVYGDADSKSDKVFYHTSAFIMDKNVEERFVKAVMDAKVDIVEEPTTKEIYLKYVRNRDNPVVFKVNRGKRDSILYRMVGGRVIERAMKTMEIIANMHGGESIEVNGEMRTIIRDLTMNGGG